MKLSKKIEVNKKYGMIMKRRYLRVICYEGGVVL